MSNFSFSQKNLIYNSSFEIISDCNLISGDIKKSVEWFTPSTISSSELFSSCSLNNITKTPYNIFGYCVPLTDSSYAGAYFFVPFNFGTTYREYVQTKLTSPLKIGYTYCAEFHVSLSDTSNYAISSMGIYFSTDTLKNSCSLPCLIEVNPQIYNSELSIISDKKNWTKISGSFVAQGGEQFLTIGNFNNDSITKNNYQKVSNNIVSSISDGAYYYIDNVSVYACDSPLVEEPQDTTFVFIPNVFSPNQDGENDLWEVIASKVSSLNIQVFNRWGEQVYSFNSAQLSTLDIQPSTYNPAWDGYTPTGKPVPEGTYFYIVQYTLPSGETKVEKGYVTLLR